MRVASHLLVFPAVFSGVLAQPAVPEAEALAPPTPPRLAAIHAAAQRDGWAPQSAMLRSAAIRAYEREKYPAAEAWLNAHRWAVLLGTSTADFVPRWMEA